MHWSGGEFNKVILQRSGLGNPAMLQMCLYALLVIPKESLTDDFCKDLFNIKTREMAMSYMSSYSGEKSV